MCGIFGIVSTSGAISLEVLARGVRALEHRGPDAQRQWIAGHGRAGLGHSRLSIIDLSTGDQPLANEDETLHAVVNGEFYGFEAIREELEARGHRLRTRSDSEILLHLYEDLGAACLKRLRGEFAFALWDESNDLLFAARDRFGIKPLFYTLRDGVLYLASEVKALLGAGLPLQWDLEAAFQGFGAAVLHADQTFFEGVRQVPPGHYLLFTGGKLRICSYWDFDFPAGGAGARALPIAEAAETLRATLDEAVRLRLRADVPVGCYLSGGLDSCAVLGLAARHLSRPIRAFTLSFEEEAYDEPPIAKETAAHVGAEFQSFRITARDLADHLPDALWHGESFLINTHGVAKYLLSRAVRDQGYKVVLTGEGATRCLRAIPISGGIAFSRQSAGEVTAAPRPCSPSSIRATGSLRDCCSPAAKGPRSRACSAHWAPSLPSSRHAPS
jgi:asparagine synthase (glutamine-hydrolysing)